MNTSSLQSERTKRKWIKKAQPQGLQVYQRYRKRVLKVISSNPKKDHGLGFSRYSLRVLTGFLVDKLNIVDILSHDEIRNILTKHGIK